MTKINEEDTVLMQAIKQAQTEIDQEDFVKRRIKKVWWKRIFSWVS